MNKYQQSHLEQSFVFRKGTDSVTNVIILNGEKYMATSHQSGIIQLWSYYSRRVVFTWKAHDKEILGLLLLNETVLLR